MAIAFDTTTTSATSSWSHTCSGSDRILIVTLRCADNAATAVTYNSVAMTKINEVALGGGVAATQLWLLMNPASGANTVSVTITGGVSSISASYTGVLQTGQPDAQNTNTTTSGTSLAVTVTTIADNDWLIGGAFDNGAGVLSAGA